MKKLSLSVGLLLVVASCFAFPPEANVQVQVVDPDGKPIEGARIGLSEGGGGTPSSVVYSDPKGMASGTIKTTGEIQIGVRKEGYYRIWLPKRLKIKGDLMSGSWEPNPLVARAVLRPKANPVSMYVSSVSFWHPTQRKFAEGEAASYNLETAEWGNPEQLADIVIRRVPTGNPAKFLFELKCIRPHDGIITVPAIDWHTEQRELRSPIEAPNDGYSYTKLLLDSNFNVLKSETDEAPRSIGVFVLRLRTEVDESGRVIAAQYAKIYPNSDGLTLYLNPEKNNRGLEYAVGRNLLSEKQARIHANDP